MDEAQVGTADETGLDSSIIPNDRKTLVFPSLKEMSSRTRELCIRPTKIDGCGREIRGRLDR